jgi:hypothetical protein
MTRMMNSSSVEIACYHAFCGGPWKIVNKSDDGVVYSTGIVELYKLLNEAFHDGVNIVPVGVSGPNTDRSNPQCLFTAAALTTAEGVNLILVNRDESVCRDVKIEFRNRYVPVKAAILTAPSVFSYDTVDSRPIETTRTLFSGKENLEQFTVPEKSIVLLKLSRKTDLTP